MAFLQTERNPYNRREGKGRERKKRGKEGERKRNKKERRQMDTQININFFSLPFASGYIWYLLFSHVVAGNY